MINVVWILIATTTHGWTVPTIEFSSEARCVAAAQQIKEQVTIRKKHSTSEGFCVRVEK